MLYVSNYWRDAVNTTMRHHLIPVKMSVMKKFTSNMSERMWRKGNLCILLMGCILAQLLGVASLMEKLYVLKKLCSDMSFIAAGHGSVLMNQLCILDVFKQMHT